MTDQYLAHSPTGSQTQGQPLKEHLENVSNLSANFCGAFGAEQDGRLCGLYHDIGKYSTAFQQRLRGSAKPVDHSTAGAHLLFEHRNVPAAMCIAGHHAGLADLGTRNDLGDTFMGRMNHSVKDGIESCDAWRNELPAAIPAGDMHPPGLETYFYIKMLFSGLTDGDWLDTEAYFENRPVQPPAYSLAALSEKLDVYISRWDDPKTDVNRRRCSILHTAIQHSQDSPGLFSMTVPTGGGKTVSSMAFALRHALCHAKRRIIYVIPYCSILEQTQQIFEEVFGKENLTAHYSGAEYSVPEDGADRPAFATENWGAPIILTTAVQFFESLYSNRPGKNRKLHNIAQSVMVFDEAQMLPVPYLRPCLAAICQLVKRFGCSAVLCTATQPAVGRILQEYLPEHPVRELCPEPDKMAQAFRRVCYVDEGELSDDTLTAQLLQCAQVLCVVNSRRQAQDLYRALGTGDGTYHLSTLMTPSDRKQALNEIRERLKEGRNCRVISTSLIEAGVDVNFPVVYRALAGLDSIIQSGGRCNREGKRPQSESTVHIFRTSAKPPRMLEQNISAAERTLRRFAELDSPAAIHAYFDFLFYRLRDDAQLDEKSILEQAKKLRFRTVSEQFKMIDGADDTIYIPQDEGAELIQTLREYGPSRTLLRKLGQYGVNVYHWFFIQLCDMGKVEPVSENAGILLDLNLYSRQTGLPLSVPEQGNVYFI